MSIRRIFFFVLVAIAFLLATGIPTKSQNPGQEIIAGRNVNMVSGTLLPLGDPFLQRQNEPSIAVSSRSPMHLFAAANDYRTIDMPHPYEPRGIPGVAAGRDAWIGVFESFDGGESFVSMLLPGFPQDSSIEGSASPIYGFDTACDPRVCAGAEGLFYLSGIAFMRNQLAGVVFVARYVDRNNREKVEEVVDEISGERKYVGPIEYVDTRIAGVGNPGQFIDMPNMAVDVPRGTAQYGNVYLAYTVFLGNTSINVRSRVVVVRSTDGGANWSKPIKLTESQHIIQRPVIAIDPSDSTGKTIYVTFRRFAHGRTPGGIAFVKSIDGGMSFTKPADVATLLCPFDQWTKGDSTITSLRTNSYPTMAVEVVDENGVPKGVPYVAWAQRYAQNGQPDPDGQSRIVFSYSLNGGLTWLDPPQLVDPYYEGDGHQFMPSTTCAGGNKTVIWYDQRDDISLHDPNTKFIEDVWLDHRHTIDVRAAEAPVGSPIFGRSILLSRYLFFMQLNEDGNPYRLCEECDPILWQGEYNYSGFPLFHLGTKPFQGDYIEVTPSPQILPPPAPGSNSWAFNTDPSEPTRSHGVWTDTRDVRPPGPPGFELWGNWINYNPPTSEQDIDFEQQNPCNNKDTTGMRNQNIYTADLNHGVIVGSPGNNKQLNRQRSFVVFVKDTNAVENRIFRLSLDEVGGVNASFAQSGTDVNYLDITVPPNSSVSCTVYVDLNPNLFAPVIVNVNEDEGGPLVGRVYLNPDSNNNPLLGPDGKPLLDESHIPGMSNPKIWKYHVGNQNEPNASFLSPRAQNPRAQNSGYINPRAQNPRAQNPRAQNPRAQNPRAQNENIVNNEMLNPRAQNPRAQNTALTDMTWTVTNDGNTTSAYSFNIASDSPDALNEEFENDYLIAQVLVYKTHMVPIDNECELFQTHADELIVNFTNPRAQNPRAQNVAPSSSNITTLGISSTEQNDSIEPITFYLASGEEAEVILRVYDPNTEEGNSFDDYINDIGGETEAEAADTGEDEPEWAEQPDAPWGPEPSYLPEIDTSATSLSFATVLEVNPDDQILTICNTGGGTLDYTISDDADWLSVLPLDGTSEGPPGEGCDEQVHTVSVVVSGLALGTYQGTITITDPNATNNPVRLPVTLTIAVAPPAATITGTVKYNEFPVTNYTNKTVDFWARDETTGKSFSISPTYDNTSGTYSIPNMPSGTYGIRVNVDDAEPLDGKNFPGDYYGWTSPIEVKEGDTVVNVDLDCQKIMHLTAPIDNLNEQHWAGPDYDTWQSPITFDWDAISEASTYKYRVAKYQSNPYQYIETVVSTTETSNTQADITLAESSVNQHYQFYLYAYSADDVDVMVGRFMIVYNGHGWDYRFRVIEGCGVAGDMYYSRAHHRATRLQDGRVLITGGQGVITGGQGGSGYLESVEIYNSCFPWGGLINPNIENPNILNPIHFMEFEHSEHTATLLSDGKVLVVGGYGTGYSEAEIYDPDTHLFSRTTNAPLPRTQHTATLLEDHNVLIVGGFGAGSTAEIFDPGTDPASDTFTQITGPDRYHHTATLLKDGKVLIVGGRDSSNNPLDSAVIYDPGSGFSSVGDTMSVARHNHTATLLPDGKVLIAGGTNWDGSQGNPLNTAEIFDPGTGTGTFETPITMVSTHAAHTATLLDDGTVLLTGGDSQGTVEIYYPSTGRFRSAGSMTTSRSEHTATILPDGTVLITGGNPGNELNSAEIFYPIALATYLYGVNSNDDGLSIIDPDSGQVTFIGPLDPDLSKFTTPIAMAVRPTDGKIFVWNNSPTGVLLAVDPCKGAATKVNPTAEDQGTQHALAFASDGKLFGVSSTLLYEIDTISGVKSLKGDLNLGLRAAYGADFDANGVLYAITFDFNAPNAFKELITIDTSTGQGSIVATLSEDIGVPGSIVFDESGKLIGSGLDSPQGEILFDINPADGTVSNIRTLSGGTTPQGMGFAPRKKLY